MLHLSVCLGNETWFTSAAYLLGEDLLEESLLPEQFTFYERGITVELWSINGSKVKGQLISSLLRNWRNILYNSPVK